MQLLNSLQSIKPEFGNIEKLANTFKGHFGILYRDNTKVIAITDCVASFPIFCKEHHNGYILSTSGKSLVIDEEVDDSQVIALSFSGYTIGEHTLFRNVSILGHGKVFLHSKDGASIISNYYEYSPWNPDRGSPVSTLKAELSELTLNMILRVIEQAGPNRIAVPLSAGVDSRLIVSALKELGARDILCYSYGTKGNFEAKIAKQIAQKLGYDWTFVELSPQKQRQFWKTGVPHKFANDTNDFIAAPVHHDLLVTVELLDKGYIDQNTLIVNGNSGDFISGIICHKSYFLSKALTAKTISNS